MEYRRSSAAGSRTRHNGHAANKNSMFYNGHNKRNSDHKSILGPVSLPSLRNESNGAQPSSSNKLEIVNEMYASSNFYVSSLKSTNSVDEIAGGQKAPAQRFPNHTENASVYKPKSKFVAAGQPKAANNLTNDNVYNNYSTSAPTVPDTSNFTPKIVTRDKQLQQQQKQEPINRKEKRAAPKGPQLDPSNPYCTYFDPDAVFEKPAQIETQQPSTIERPRKPHTSTQKAPLILEKKSAHNSEPTSSQNTSDSPQQRPAMKQPGMRNRPSTRQNKNSEPKVSSKQDQKPSENVRENDPSHKISKNPSKSASVSKSTRSNGKSTAAVRTNQPGNNNHQNKKSQAHHQKEVLKSVAKPLESKEAARDGNAAKSQVPKKQPPKKRKQISVKLIPST